MNQKSLRNKPMAVDPAMCSDHCIDHRAVPGVLSADFDLRDYPHPSYRDIPALTIGATPSHADAARPPALGDEEREAIEERLESLGCL
jgi:hypothetical protein